MAQAIHLDQWFPYSVREPILDEEMPKAVWLLIDLRHRKIGQDRCDFFRTSFPDWFVREESSVDVFISFLQLFSRHSLGLIHDMTRVVQRPILVEDSSFLLILLKQWSRRVGCQDVKGCALQPICFNPVSSLLKYVGFIMIKTKNKTPIYLDAVVMEYFDPLYVLFWKRWFFSRV